MQINIFPLEKKKKEKTAHYLEQNSFCWFNRKYIEAVVTFMKQ